MPKVTKLTTVSDKAVMEGLNDEGFLYSIG